MKNLYLIICNMQHKLISNDGKQWELAQMIDQYILHEWGAHSLDYWRKKGVIESEEERKR